MKNLYKIAGLTVEMDSFGRTVSQAEPYLCDESSQPDIVISSDWKSLKQKAPHLSDEDCEYLSSGGSFYSQLINFEGFFLHSSAAIAEGKAYLFSAPCGTGKSTHTSLWKKTFGEDKIKILNDDKPALRLEDGVWYAYGTPWSGKTDQNINTRVPLGGICVLSQAKDNKIEAYKGSKALFSLLDQTLRPAGTEARTKLLDLLSDLLEKVPVWKLQCNMEPEAAVLSYETMTGKRKDTL